MTTNCRYVYKKNHYRVSRVQSNLIVPILSLICCAVDSVVGISRRLKSINKSRAIACHSRSWPDISLAWTKNTWWKATTNSQSQPSFRAQSSTQNSTETKSSRPGTEKQTEPQRKPSFPSPNSNPFLLSLFFLSPLKAGVCLYASRSGTGWRRQATASSPWLVSLNVGRCRPKNLAKADTLNSPGGGRRHAPKEHRWRNHESPLSPGRTIRPGTVYLRTNSSVCSQSRDTSVVNASAL